MIKLELGLHFMDKVGVRERLRVRVRVMTPPYREDDDKED